MVNPGGGAFSYERGTPVHVVKKRRQECTLPLLLESIQELLEVKDTHRPQEDLMLLGMELP